jgi:hypothetical protein
MDFYDAHVHFLRRGSREETIRGWDPVCGQGLRGMAVIIMGYHPADRSRCLSLIPAAYHDLIDQTVFDRPADPEKSLPGDMLEIPLFPYLDSRFMEEGVTDLGAFRDSGYRGLKILYIPEEDRENRMAGWKNVFGRSVRASENLTARLVEQAAGFDWPVIFHADLRRYAPFVEDVIGSFSGTTFVIPHFGFSRKAVDRVLNRFENTYTDFSSLLPFMQGAAGAYEDFIIAHQNRVLFGSDATMGWPELTLEYLAFAEQAIRDEEVRRRVLAENYLRIHAPAAHA